MVENPSDIAHGMWSNNESMKSSTWKELTAVKNILFSMNNFLHNKRIKWFTDNQNVADVLFPLMDNQCYWYRCAHS